MLIHPASLLNSHNYRSGFLEHILSMSRSAILMSRLYKLDKDLILTGILVHDIGKLIAIDYDYESTISKDGNLIGHIVIGRDLTTKEAEKIKKFPKLIPSATSAHISLFTKVLIVEIPIIL